MSSLQVRHLRMPFFSPPKPRRKRIDKDVSDKAKGLTREQDYLVKTAILRAKVCLEDRIQKLSARHGPTVAMARTYLGSHVSTGAVIAGLRIILDRLHLQSHGKGFWWVPDTGASLAFVRCPMSVSCPEVDPRVYLHDSFFHCSLAERAGCIIHEISHIALGLDDVVVGNTTAYGYDLCLHLARELPGQAIRNADSWASFVDCRLDFFI